MKAISIRQPYAELIIRGAKTCEFRSRPIRYRGPLLIHAATFRGRWRVGWVAEDGGAEGDWTEGHWPRGGEPFPDPNAVEYGCLIGTVQVVDCLTFCEVKERFPDQAGAAPFDGYAWLLSDPQRLPAPVPIRGRLGLWDVPESVLRQPVKA